MSFEGFYQILCRNGHMWEVDTYAKGAIECEHCHAPVVWWNLVDETNGTYELDHNEVMTGKRIDGFVELEEIAAPEMHTCSCGHVHEVSPPRYRMPSDAGHFEPNGIGDDFYL